METTDLSQKEPGLAMVLGSVMGAGRPEVKEKGFQYVSIRLVESCLMHEPLFLGGRCLCSFRA